MKEAFLPKGYATLSDQDRQRWLLESVEKIGLEETFAKFSLLARYQMKGQYASVFAKDLYQLMQKLSPKNCSTKEFYSRLTNKCVKDTPSNRKLQTERLDALTAMYGQLNLRNEVVEAKRSVSRRASVNEGNSRKVSFLMCTDGSTLTVVKNLLMSDVGDEEQTHKAFLANQLHRFEIQKEKVYTFTIISEMKNASEGQDMYLYQYEPQKNNFLYVQLSSVYFAGQVTTAAYQLRNKKQAILVKTDDEIRQALLKAIAKIPDVDFRWLANDAVLVGLEESEEYYAASKPITAVFMPLLKYIGTFAHDDVIPGERGAYAWALGMVYKGRAYLNKLASLEGKGLITHLNEADQYELAQAYKKK